MKLDEEPRLRHARDLPIECGPDPAGEEVRDQAVDCLTLSRHGPPLGRRYLGADLDELGPVRAVGQPVLAELKRADQRPVDDEVGVAPDR